MSDPADTCAHCGTQRSAHYALNYADGPMVSGTVLVCVTSTFTPKAKPRKAGSATKASKAKRAQTPRRSEAP